MMVMVMMKMRILVGYLGMKGVVPMLPRQGGSIECLR